MKNLLPCPFCEKELKMHGEFAVHPRNECVLGLVPIKFNTNNPIWVKAWNTRTAPKKITKKRKYFRKCGVCGSRHEQSDMIRTNLSPNGWLCIDCHINEHPEYYDEEF